MTVVLLDTHPLLWALGRDPRLPEALAERLDADPSRFLVSDATLWEIAIKRSTGKITVPDDLPRIVDDLGFGAAPITRRQTWAVRALPFHHRDPFDRLLISQARDLRIPVVTADAAFSAYEVQVDWPTSPPAS
ncbi:MAG: type II toxin-antitoxin system VapC family toxin [Solirubrobacteraceae bacterium]|nr:type II toxin-antitoxin system VapC family toxin [Solirubrobacteraceae bacterium]